MKHIDYLEGPVYAAMWKFKNKNILLCGDWHVLTPGCLHNNCQKQQIARLEHLIFAEATKMEPNILDVFVEYPRYWQSLSQKAKDTIIHTHKTDHQLNTSDYVDLLVNFLRGCYQNPGCKYHCYFHNVRLHAADVRQNKHHFDQIYNTSLMYLNEKNHLIRTTAQTSEQRLNRQCFATLKEQFKLLHDAIQSYNTTSNQNITHLIQIEIQNSKIIKQFKKIQNKHLRNKLYNEYVTTKFNKCQHLQQIQIHDLITAISDIQTNTSSKWKAKNINLIAQFLKHWVFETSWLVDAYTIGRIFSTFQDGSTVNNAIILLGSAHIHDIEFSLNQLGATCAWTRGTHIFENQKQCLDLRKIKQPFFTTNNQKS